MSYLVIKNDVTSKQYKLTESYNKPYISVKNQGVLPITTSTTTGLQLKQNISGQIYRAMEYMSSSTSKTYYTSQEQSEGLSSVTALTRESTSGTSYLTGSTTNQMYMVSKQNCFTNRASEVNAYHYDFVTSSGTNISLSSYLISNTSSVLSGVSSTRITVSMLGYYTSSLAYTRSSIYGRATPYQTSYTTYSSTRTLNRASLQFNIGPSSSEIQSNSQTTYLRYNKLDLNESILSSGQYSTARSYVHGASNTSGYTYTNYATCTVLELYIDLNSSAVSTIGTSYLTRESTSGYSGVSSSSSETSGWQ